VENVVQANIKAVFAPDTSTNQVYNIAVGESISLNKLFSFLQQLASSSIAPQYVAERSGDIRNSLANISKASNLLNYHPVFKIEEGLKITFDWFHDFGKA
jgi:UDP-N-acetylglucosamine 4-epimerase